MLYFILPWMQIENTKINHYMYKANVLFKCVDTYANFIK